MKSTKCFAVVELVLICIIALPGFPQSSHAHRGNAAAEAGWSELMQSMYKMHLGIESVVRSGNSDVDFVRLMLPHHQAAIDMAKAQLAYGKDPQMRRLAQEIIADQQSEIELMQLWLKQRDSLSMKGNHKNNSRE
jgi:uncharacterized protein (DUF305 family)